MWHARFLDCALWSRRCWIAIEYAYRVRERSSDTWVFWIHASNKARFEEGLRDIATCIKLPGRQDPKANIFQLVYDWLQDERKGPWVVILDNVDDACFLTLSTPEATVPTAKGTSTRHLLSYIPYSQHGSVLVTSRSEAAAMELVDRDDIITINPMNKKDAIQLFRNKLGQDDDDACVIELATALEYMPLAIVQATAYISQKRPRSSVREYINEFRKSDNRKAKLLSYKVEGLRRDKKAQNSIFITWQISFDYIRDVRPSAADLLSLISFCDRQGIPEVLMRGKYGRVTIDDAHNLRRAVSGLTIRDTSDDNTDDGKSIGSNGDSDWTYENSHCSDNDEFESDIIALRNFSFIVANKDGTTFEMHRLVQLATFAWLKAHNIYEQWNYQFLQNLAAEIPDGNFENWAKCQLLFPHAQQVSTQRPDGKEAMEEWATILHRAARYALEKGYAVEGEKLSTWAMKARKKIFDKDDEKVTSSKALVASTYSKQGRWEEAEKLQVQVMEARKQKLGADHPDTLTSMANLASTYNKQGRWEEAETLEVQVVEALKQKLGPDHPSTLTSIANLASTYSKQGRWEEAETLEVQVMEARKQKLGADHPNTLTSMNNLAWTYWNSGRLEEGKVLMSQCIRLRQAKLGASHPDYLSSVDTLSKWES
ncbi:hypothetical protein VHEMI05780 [[Torrubiella] hemipterigena]|uniref:Kinesin light chain n=1 Tax=[Torrubiella] hemipterigena TaxID=1531966 RepID=A0A0A1SYT2_9HYPO|nr:hypothetical protein VHEMI05780 [[Torrubiella] hemipterigena]